MFVLAVMTAGRETSWLPDRRRPGSLPDEEQHKLTALEGLAALSLDALSSVAYGPQAIIIVLATAGAAALHYTLPVTLAIVLLLAVLVISYRQVIEAFPNGGGAYAVAKAHLGVKPSLIAAASLVVDYILNAAVGVSAGVEALTSAFQPLYPDRVWLCLAVLAADHRGQPVGRGRVGPAVHRCRPSCSSSAIFAVIIGGLVRSPSAAVPAGCSRLLGHGDCRAAAAAEGVRLRLLGADRRGGDRERGAGVPAGRGSAGPSTPRSGLA